MRATMALRKQMIIHNNISFFMSLPWVFSTEFSKIFQYIFFTQNLRRAAFGSLKSKVIYWNFEPFHSNILLAETYPKYLCCLYCNHYVNIIYRNLEKEQAKLTKVNMNMNQKSVMNVEIIFSGHWKNLEYFSLTLNCLNIQKQSSRGVLQKSVLTNFAKFTRKHLFRKRDIERAKNIQVNGAKNIQKYQRLGGKSNS